LYGCVKQPFSSMVSALLTVAVAIASSLFASLAAAEVIALGPLPISQASSAELPRSRPVVDAADATRRAIAVANDALKSYRARPFTDTNNLAVLRFNRWIWKGLVGYGKGDLEVTVYIQADGTTRHGITEWVTSVDSRF
jgi:hypothetical protein